MRKTENYLLNQWDDSDRVLREDFNADNAAVDAALYELAQQGALTQLCAFTVNNQITGSSVFTMPVSEINWPNWQSIFVDFALKGSGYMLLYPNNNPQGAFSSGYITSSSYDSLAGMITCDYDGKAITRAEFQIFCKSTKTLQVVCPFDKVTGRSEYTYSELTSLHLTPYHESYTMEVGSTITFWGMR